MEREEGPYDRHLERFKSLAERLESLASSVPIVVKGGDARSVKFTFDMGFMPIMSFCTLKCRDLKTRLRFWRLMPTLACARESLWNLNLMTGLARRVIEIEHNIRVHDDGQHTIPDTSEPLTERMRIRHLWADSMPTCRVIHGQTIVGRIAGFFLLDEDCNIHCQTEFFDDMDYNNG